MTALEIKQQLIEGNKRFMNNQLEGKLHGLRRRRIELLTEQKPHTIILSCSDSRVVPELIFDAGLGEFYVARVEGNIANIDSIASIEYALRNFHSKLIVVLGHQNCCAVSSAFVGGDNGYNLNHLLSHIIPALSKSPDGATVNDVAKKNAILTTQDLLDRSNLIKQAKEEGKVKLIPAYYNLDSGLVEFLK
jgi:carbonic anhydrase